MTGGGEQVQDDAAVIVEVAPVVDDLRCFAGFHGAGHPADARGGHDGPLEIQPIGFTDTFLEVIPWKMAEKTIRLDHPAAVPLAAMVVAVQCSGQFGLLCQPPVVALPVAIAFHPAAAGWQPPQPGLPLRGLLPAVTTSNTVRSIASETWFVFFANWRKEGGHCLPIMPSESTQGFFLEKSSRMRSQPC